MLPRRHAAEALLAVTLALLSAAFGTGCRKRQTEPPAPKQYELGVTGAGQALTRITAEAVAESRPAISPDGAILLFGVQVGDARGQMKEATIVGVDPNTGARRTLYTATTSLANEPAWLPDGSSFVFSSNAVGSWSLVRALTNSPNAAISVVVSGELAPSASRPCLSPDGRRVAFATRIRESWHVAVVGADGSQLTMLGPGEEPAWSPDGKLLAFRRVVNQVPQVFIINPESGTGLVQVTSGETSNISPTWSPDSRFLVFSSNRGWNSRKGGSSTGTWNLFVVKPDGTNLVQLTDGDGSSIHPCWGRDGWIYFSSNQAGNFDIWRLRPSPNLYQPLVPPSARPAAPTAAPAPASGVPFDPFGGK